MSEFERCHPAVSFVYFIAVIVLTCVLFHPIMLAISFMGGIAYLCVMDGMNALKKCALFVLPVVLIMAAVNPAFNHAGMTILWYFPNGNPLTLESIIYGLASAVMIAGVIIHFMSFSKVMTSDKFVWLFGKTVPSLSLIFSMTLRFVPRFIRQFKMTAEAQKFAGRDLSEGGILSRVKKALTIMSIMVTWSLENAIQLSDSMKCRGYGLPGRTAFSIHVFSAQDRNVMLLMVLSVIYTVMGKAVGAIDFGCFPSIQISESTVFGISVFLIYFVLVWIPVLLEVAGVLKWNYLKSQS